MLLLAVASGLPALLSRYPVAIDLPQHLAQLRLWEDLTAGRVDPQVYVVSWISPNTAIYALLLPFWRLFSPLTATRLGLAAVMLSWTGGVFLLAEARGRSRANALVAGVCSFNLCLSWGLVNFVVGFPPSFSGGCSRAGRPRRPERSVLWA